MDLDVANYLKGFSFRENEKEKLTLDFVPGRITQIEYFTAGGHCIPKYVNEFWTAKQRQASSLQEISYRACFKPQLPRFFINLLSKKNDLVYDPFSGRGTTVLEAGMMGRRVISNDINPLSRILAEPRFSVPSLLALKKRLAELPVDYSLRAERDLSMFYHQRTEAEIVSLKSYLQQRYKSGEEDDLDRWIRMVATNRLTGHSPGFFSVYTLPPNQAVTPERQMKINRQRKQKPPYRDTKQIILKKSRSLMRNLTFEQAQSLQKAAGTALFLEKEARSTPEIQPGSVQLTVTSPPFLDIVQYSRDNWLRCWFNALDLEQIEAKITMSRKIEEWTAVMDKVFRELFRITKKKGWVAFEVGEIRRGKINLEEYVVPLGLGTGFTCEGVLINQQEFTKTSNIWGINNNSSGTNTNRIILFKKQA
ncbi:MAG: DNA methyltransferase [Dethiobacteria bacterium]